MTFIYSFLQKRKMHENQHGIIMIVTAYILSVLMLALGSDVFYNINSEAAGISTESVEETQDFFDNRISELENTDDISLVTQSQLINPYKLSNPAESAVSVSYEQSTSASEDTVWFLGNAMDNQAFDSLMGQMDSILPEDKTAQKADESTKAEKSVESFSVEVASGNKIVTITQEEVAMLERIVESEASGEDMVGKILIANVIFNRMVDDEFPDTVEDVIFQNVDGDYQFSPVANDRYWSVDISADTEKAVKRALEGEDYSEGALYFIARKRTSSANARWFDNHLEWLFKHGGHEFYKNK